MDPDARPTLSDLLAWLLGGTEARTGRVDGDLSASAQVTEAIANNIRPLADLGHPSKEAPMALPTASTPGYTTFRGRVTCVCLAEWLPVYETLLLARGLIKASIDPWQLTGGAAASGGTHTQGGAFDLLYQTGTGHVAVSREMGAPATWARTVSQGFSKAHLHGVLTDCPHNSPARYQITAQRRGYNGLGVATSGTYAGQWGYGGRDEFPPPQTYRTWRQGIDWALVEIARLAPKPPPAIAPIPTPAPQEDDMFSDADRATLNAIKQTLAALDSKEDGRYVVDSNRYNYLAGSIRLAQVDPAALATRIAAALPSADSATKEALTAALREVLGSLDSTPDAPTPA